METEGTEDPTVTAGRGGQMSQCAPLYPSAGPLSQDPGRGTEDTGLPRGLGQGKPWAVSQPLGPCLALPPNSM